MALVIYWYDIVCFGIVAASFVVSLGVLWRRDLASKCDDNFLYQSLLVARPDINDQTVLAMPRNHVGSSQLWTSCWKGVHPGWLLATRFISFLVMAGLLWRDIVDWDATIFMYYTDLVFSFLISSGQLSRQEPLWFGSRIHPCLILQKDFGTGSDGKSQKQGQSRCIFMISGSHAGDIFLFSLLVSHALSGSLLRWCFCLLFLHSFLILKLLYGNVNVIVNWFLILVSNLSAQMDIYVDYDIFRDMSNILGTVMSAYGCWVSLKQPAVSEHGENSVFLKRDVEEDGTTTSTTYKEKKSGGTIKLRSHCAEEAIRERAGFWGYLMQIIYQLMGCMHSLNAVFLVLDTALNSLPFPWFRLAYFVQWSCLYVIFQWVIHACGFTWWPYPFLELNTPWAPLWYFAMAVIHIPCYGIYALIFKAKNTIFPRLFPRSFERSH
ncbi:hypothetical protein NC652_007025 [Populus alba x Populus x berolinensis]|nr:hypothetical protein NC652_007025 [Populus alba x Populus x berolinensis]